MIVGFLAFSFAGITCGVGLFKLSSTVISVDYDFIGMLSADTAENSDV